MTEPEVLTADMLTDMVRILDPEWMLNPPKPGSPEWEALPDEKRNQLIGRMMRRIDVHDDGLYWLRRHFPPDEDTPLQRINGVEVRVNRYVPRNFVAIFDGQNRLLCVSKLPLDAASTSTDGARGATG